MGLKEGRRADDKWQDYSLNGHQIVCHYVGDNYRCQDFVNPVDGDEVPVPHFGVVLTEPLFHELSERLKAHNIKFIIEPHKRFLGMPGEVNRLDKYSMWLLTCYCFDIFLIRRAMDNVLQRFFRK